MRMSTLLWFLVGVSLSAFEAWVIVVVYRRSNQTAHVQQQVQQLKVAHDDRRQTERANIRSNEIDVRPPRMHVSLPPLGLGRIEVLPFPTIAREAILTADVNVSAFLDLSRALLPPPKYDCRKMNTLPAYMQCAYSPENDVHVSGSILRDGSWEPSKAIDMQMSWVYVQDRVPDRPILFVDVGANLGLFSLFAAATGLRCDPMCDNAN
jgi:hypothetical protein